MYMFQNQTGQLKWTTENPNIVGFYWFSQKDDTKDEGHHKPIIVNVIQLDDYDDDLSIMFPGGRIDLMYIYSGKGDKWAGPIQPPQE